MKFSSLAATAAIASLLFAGAVPALAQTTAPAAPAAKSDAAAPASADKKASKPRSAESLDCSKQADEKGLKGKERKKFRHDCIKSAKAGEAAK